MLTELDTGIFFFFNCDTANPFFDILMPALTNRGFLLVFPLLVLVLLRGAQRRSALFPAVLAVGIPVAAFFLADRLNDLIKTAVARPRPCDALAGVRLLVRCPHSFSFPSGHAIASFAFAGSFFTLAGNFLRRAWRIGVLALAATIAWSRMYVGVHYPSDVAAGCVLGIAIAVVAALPLGAWLRRKEFPGP